MKDPDSEITKILFVKLHKSAGSTIKAAIKKSKYECINKGHLPLSRYKIDRHTLVVGNIRNPYSHYVSLWAFGCQKKGGYYKRIAGAYENKRDLYESCEHIGKFQKWLKFTLSPEICNEPTIGFYTQRFLTI